MSRLWLSLHEPQLQKHLRTHWLTPWEVFSLDATSVIAQLAQGMRGVWVVQAGTDGGLTRETLAQAIEQSPGSFYVLVLLPPSMQAEAVHWLDAGADRCLPLNVDRASLVAMLHALERRTRGQAASVSEWAPIRFDHRTMALSIRSQAVALTPREGQVMALMVRRVGKMVSKQELLQALGVNSDRFLRSSVVHLFIHRINRKLAASGVHIDGVKRLGYALRIDRSAFWAGWPSPSWEGVPIGQALAGALSRKPAAV